MTHKHLTAEMVRNQVKACARDAGLDENYFSTHSLRKAAMSHMRATGASVEDMRDRGNYAEGSLVMNRVYDYSAAGHGPLSSNSLEGGPALTIEDIKLYLP